METHNFGIDLDKRLFDVDLGQKFEAHAKFAYEKNVYLF